MTGHPVPESMSIAEADGEEMGRSGIKRLRLSYVPVAGGSAIGAFAEACDASGVTHLDVAAKGADLPTRYIGNLQIGDDRQFATMARVMRCSATAVATVGYRAHPDRHNKILLGDLVVSRGAIDLTVRRIGPRSLASHDYHRGAWLNRMLPYCPESLELLVQSCPICGPLGWMYARGMMNCDKCGRPVPPSPEPMLPARMVEPYRDFARLVSSNGVTARQVVSGLPDALRGFSRSTLVGMALRIGMRCRDVWIYNGGKNGLFEHDSTTITDVVCRGMEMLSDWPNGLRAYVEARETEIAGERKAYQQLIADVRWVAAGASSDEEGRNVIATAFPKLNSGIADALSTGQRYYLAKSVNDILWTCGAKLKALRDGKVIGFDEIPSGQRTRARYDADDVDRLRARLADCDADGTIAVRFDIPVYAVGQLAIRGVLDVIDDPGVIILRGPQVGKASADRLARSLTENRIEGDIPGNWMPLRRAMAQFQGEKPWGRVIHALSDGEIPFRVKGPVPTGRTIHVDPLSLAAWGEPPTDLKADPLNTDLIALRDTSDVLGCDAQEGNAAAVSAGLPVMKTRRGKGVDRISLRKLSTQIIFTKELALLSTTSGRRWDHILGAAGVPRLHGGWCRAAVDRKGVHLLLSR
ncbi:hypothetical protein [uncultured Sphingomonas sp.]|uniref:hypothetical protein n=1 Tax=uncultured Sphingomonas sp. TaxID=158754 RepID=UPI001577615D